MPVDLKPYMVERQGKTFVLYAGLLGHAHDLGLEGITTVLIQVPSDENGRVAIVMASVTMKSANANRPEAVRVFTGIGDASPDNVARMMIPHILRMAETRAKARALRDATNIAVTSVEELGPGGSGADDDDDAPRNGHASMERVFDKQETRKPEPARPPAKADKDYTEADRPDLLNRWAAAAEKLTSAGKKLPGFTITEDEPLLKLIPKIKSLEQMAGVKG
jgi:hypothetical protein